jgi:hypothetical protein
MRPLILCALLLAPLPVVAQTGAGNLPPDFYPPPHCEKPQSLGKPPALMNQLQMQAYNAPVMQAYNAKVKNFNSQAAAFNACMQDYSDRAQADINAIQATVHAAVAAANAN